MNAQTATAADTFAVVHTYAGDQVVFEGTYAQCWGYTKRNTPKRDGMVRTLQFLEIREVIGGVVASSEYQPEVDEDEGDEY